MNRFKNNDFDKYIYLSNANIVYGNKSANLTLTMFEYYFYKTNELPIVLSVQSYVVFMNGSVYKILLTSSELLSA